MKALRTLLRQPADNCVALTYNLDLPFFEYMLFEPLYNRGCRNVTVLCDPRQHEIALGDIPALKHLGQRYLCLPITIAQTAFHPKLVLLTSDEEGLLLVGSGNVSRSGLTHNHEVWTSFRYTSSAPDEPARAACRWAFDYVSRIEELEQNPMLRERLAQLWRTTRWLRQEPAQSEGSYDYWLLHNLDRPIFDQMYELWAIHDGTTVEEALLVSPYFDRRALVFEALLQRLQPRNISLITEHAAPGLDPAAVRRLLDDAGVAWSAKQPEPGPRRLHAKVLTLRTETGGWLLTGSPNFSSPAMLRSMRDGNVELATLRYEPDPAYAGTFMHQISETAIPLELDWHPVLEEMHDLSDDEPTGYRLVHAEFTGQKLILTVEPSLPEGTRIRVELSGQEDKSFEVDRWTRDGESVVLEPPGDIRSLLSTPVFMRLVLLTSTDTQVWTTRAVVNNGDALRTSSRPVRRQEQVRVPGRLVAEDFEQNIELLNRLQNLLALNPQQLRERRGLSSQVTKDLEREDAITTEKGEYDPEAMIVDERLQRIEVHTGSDLYVDFYERAFYEDVLAAARAAVYHPVSQPTPEPDATDEDDSASDLSERSEPIVTPRVDEDVEQRVSRSFTRLANNFERGMHDSEYLIQVPPPYLQELFFILTTYLRILWRQGLIDDHSFFELSEKLFAAFLGDERRSTGWSALSPLADEEQLAWEEAKSHFRKQAWLHLYMLADYALVEEEELLPGLARLMRRAAQELAPPTILTELSADSLASMWHSSFLRDRAAPKPQEVVEDLVEYSQWYSEETLRRELAWSLGVSASIERVSDWGLNSVPALWIDGPWKDEHLDTYWQYFTKFCRWPRRKYNARLEVRDSNPSLSREDAKRLVLFYKGSLRRLSVWSNPNDGALARMAQITGVSLQELGKIPNFGDVIYHPHAVTRWLRS